MRFVSRLGLRFSAVLAMVVLCVVVVLALVAMHQLRLFGETAVEQNQTHILAQADDYLAEKTHERALHLRAVFHQAEAQVSVLARRVEQVMNDRSFYASKNYNPSETFSVEPKNGIYTNQTDSVASGVYWGGATLPEAIKRDLTALSHVDPMLEDSRNSVPGAAAAWLITPQSIARYVPNIHHVDFMPPVDEYDYLMDLCYLIATPERNPSRQVAWHEVYLDSMGQGLVITAAAPAYGASGQFLASVGMDISLDGILEGVLLADTQAGSDGFSFVVDQSGRLVAFPEEKLSVVGLQVSDHENFSPGPLLQYSLHDTTNKHLKSTLEDVLSGLSMRLRLPLDGAEYLLAVESLGSMGWTLVHAVPMREVLSSVKLTREGILTTREAIVSRYTLIAVVVLLFSLGITLVFFSVSFFRPLEKIMGTVRQVSKGELDARAGLKRDDEIGELGQAVDDMTSMLEQQHKEILAVQELYRDLFDGAMSGLYRFTPSGKVVSVNQAFAEMFGYANPAEVIHSVRDIGTDLYADPEARPEIVKQVLEDGDIAGREVQMRRRDGTTFWAAITARVVHDINGETVFFDGALVDITDRKRAEEYRSRLSRELIRIQETERRKMATELHDNLAQELSALKISLGMVLDEQPNVAAGTLEKIHKCEEVLSRSIAGVRGMAQGLGPFGLEQIGLVGMLREYCARFMESSGVALEFQAAGVTVDTLSDDATVHVFRIVQEALNNINKHAEASKVSVRLVASYPNIIVRVEDDGVGFESEALSDNMLTETRMGLMSIRERVRLLGGTVNIDSVTGRGTRIVVEVPIDGQAGQDSSP